LWHLFNQLLDHGDFCVQMDSSGEGQRFWSEMVHALETRFFFRWEYGMTSGPYVRVASVSVVFGFMKWWMENRTEINMQTAYIGAVYALRWIRCARSVA